MHTGGHVAEIGNLAVERPRAASIGVGGVTLVAEELRVDACAPLNRFRAGSLFRWLRDVGNVGRTGWERRSAAKLERPQARGPGLRSYGWHVAGCGEAPESPSP